ncbi:MAG: CAP domain-containing protein [Deltaproteobacteria bacterium]|nr:CAP domain-containing protein [Deltaproteobacteria bacterium]
MPALYELLLIVGTIFAGNLAKPCEQSDSSECHHSTLLSYERWVPPPKLRPFEKRISQIIKNWGKTRDLSLSYDARLSLVAQSALNDVPRNPQERIDLEALKIKSYHLGFTDAGLAAIALRTPLSHNVDQIIADELKSRFASLSPTCFGVGAIVSGNERIVMILVAKRMVRLLPMPAVVKRGQQINLAGRVVVAASDSYTKIIIALGLPDGTVQRRKLTLTKRQFATTIHAGYQKGILNVQILIDRALGPEIASQFLIGIEQNIDAKKIHRVVNEYKDNQKFSIQERKAQLLALILGSREAVGVVLPAANISLDEVANAHAVDMKTHNFFAHVSPHYGDLAQRLAQRQILVSRALENLARANSVEEVLQQWLASPAHRANLLDPDVDAMGIGIQLTANSQILAVLVLVRRADEGDSKELATRTLSRINVKRLRLGLNALTFDEELSRLARLHCSAVANGRDGEEIVTEIKQQLIGYSISVNSFMGTNIDIVTHSDDLRLCYERVGIGVIRLQPNDARLWITVIYVKD